MRQRPTVHAPAPPAAHRAAAGRARAFHPQSQGRAHGWHRPRKTPILLATSCAPASNRAQTEASDGPKSPQRYHGGLSPVTPADANFGRASTILRQRERIKRQTIEHRRLQHRKLAA